MSSPQDTKASRPQKSRGRKRHVPQRTCVICRTVQGKRELVRLVRTPEGLLVVDKTGKQNGRGAYLCRQRSCWETAIKGRQLSKALNMEMSERERQVLRDAIEREFDPPAPAAS